MDDVERRKVKDELTKDFHKRLVEHSIGSFCLRCGTYIDATDTGLCNMCLSKLHDTVGGETLFVRMQQWSLIGVMLEYGVLLKLRFLDEHGNDIDLNMVYGEFKEHVTDKG